MVPWCLIRAGAQDTKLSHLFVQKVVIIAIIVRIILIILLRIQIIAFGLFWLLLLDFCVIVFLLLHYSDYSHYCYYCDYREPIQNLHWFNPEKKKCIFHAGLFRGTPWPSTASKAPCFSGDLIIDLQHIHLEKWFNRLCMMLWLMFPDVLFPCVSKNCSEIFSKIVDWLWNVLAAPIPLFIWNARFISSL